MMKREGLFESQGGPIIHSQIENEYGPEGRDFGSADHDYVNLPENIVVGMDIGVPWVMHKKDDFLDTVANENVKKVRYAGISPDMDAKLEKMFSQVVATKDNAFMPISGIIPVELDEEQVNSDEDDNFVAKSRTQTSRNVDADGAFLLASSSKKTSRKRKGNGEGTKQLLVSHIQDLVASRQAVPPPPISVTIKEAVEEISRIPKIYDDLDFYYFAMEFICIKSGREAFMFCPADRKVEYLKRCYQKSLE